MSLGNVPNDEEESVSLECFEAGASGVSQKLAFVQPDLVFEPSVVKTETIDLDVYFEKAPPPTFFESLLLRWPRLTVQLFEELNRDWMEEWKKGFEAFRLCGDYWVVPTWLKVPREAKTPLFIDPGMAFGTGTHATTQLAAELTVETMRKIKKRRSGISDVSALDVGTGTGILAMIAYFEGAKKVVGLDIDPEARRVARENLAGNKLTDIQIGEAALSEISEKFDLVIANIIDGVLISLRQPLLNVCKPGGWLVLSGILLERENLFIEKFFANGELPRDLLRTTRDEWLAYAYAPILD